MTHILWDIDGVLNPFEATNLVERGFTHFNDGWISWDLDLVNHADWLRELDDAASFVWASTWGEESNALVKWFHLDKLSYPHIPLQMKEGHSGTWKLASISHWVLHNLPVTEKVVWVDDELHEDAYIWAQTRGNVLLVKTEASIGLTVEQVELIHRFILE